MGFFHLIVLVQLPCLVLIGKHDYTTAKKASRDIAYSSIYVPNSEQLGCFMLPFAVVSKKNIAFRQIWIMNWTWFGSADASTKHKCTRAVASFDSFTSSSTSIIIPFCDKKKLIKNSSVLTTCCNLTSFFPLFYLFLSIALSQVHSIWSESWKPHSRVLRIAQNTRVKDFFCKGRVGMCLGHLTTATLYFWGQGGLGASIIKEKQQLLQKNCNLNKKKQEAW